MTSKNEDNKKFFPFLSQHNNQRNRILGQSYLSVTPRNGTIRIMCSGFVTLSTY